MSDGVVAGEALFRQAGKRLDGWDGEGIKDAGRAGERACFPRLPSVPSPPPCSSSLPLPLLPMVLRNKVYMKRQTLSFDLAGFCSRWHAL